MSLDITLYSSKKCNCPNCSHEFLASTDEEVSWVNITHNLRKMATESGCGILWSYSSNHEKASIFIKPIKTAIKNLEERPSYFSQFNAKNGWGTLDQFLPWLKKLLKECEDNPHSIIEISK